MKQKIAVIGGAGFLGSHLADSLSCEGHDVRVIDVRKSPWLRDDQEMVIGDIVSAEFVLSALAGIDVVYHLAGIADIGEAARDPRGTIEKNVIGSVNVFEACVASKIRRLMYASTVYVYSNLGSFYRVSKHSAEMIIEAYHQDFGLEYTILRYGSLYGPRAQDWNGVRRYISQAVKDRRIVFNATGEERREYIHVKDAARLSVEALLPEYANKCLIITGMQVLKTRELIDIIREVVGSDVKIDHKADQRDGMRYMLTPYNYTPKSGVKIVPRTFTDIGQGVLDVVHEIHHEEP